MSENVINGVTIFILVLLGCFLGLVGYNLYENSKHLNETLQKINEENPSPSKMSLGMRLDTYLMCDWSEVHEACFCVGILSTTNPGLDTKSFTWVPPSVCGK